MNYLSICQRVFTEGGISGQINSVQNQSGEANRVVGWVASAYKEILNDQSLNWKFLRKTVNVQLEAGKQAYSFADLALAGGVQFDTRSMRVAVRPDLADETDLGHMSFKAFRDFWQFSSRRLMQSRPLNVAVNDDTELVFGPTPDQAYWVSMQYQLMPEDFTNNTDTPIIPSRFHMAIVWRALRHYGIYEAGPEVVARADLAYKEVMLQLEIDQAPEVTVGGALC